jgi:hypothetical protein
MLRITYSENHTPLAGMPLLWIGRGAFSSFQLDRALLTEVFPDLATNSP